MTSAGDFNRLRRVTRDDGTSGFGGYEVETIELPFPPSVNRLWRAVKGRNIKSKPYRVWQAHAATELLLQNPTKHEGPVSVSIVVGMPDKRRRDLDNIAKPINDLLVHHQVIQRDDMEFVKKLTQEVDDSFTGIRVQVTPYAKKRVNGENILHLLNPLRTCIAAGDTEGALKLINEIEAPYVGAV